jgi:chemotaxis protein MotB
MTGQGLGSRARWLAVSTAAHVLLLATLATLILPTPSLFTARLIPVTLPGSPPAAEKLPPATSPGPQDQPAVPAPGDDPLLAVQAFRQSWIERAERLERTLTELPDAVAAKDHTIALQQSQVATLIEAQARLASELEARAAEESRVSALLAEERQRARSLEGQLTEQLRQKEAELSETQKAYAQLDAELQQEITQKEVTLRQTKDQLAIAITDRVLFPSGQADLTAEGVQILDTVGAALAKVADRQIQIEGHTDNVPIGPELRLTFPSNWELSSARASEVVRYLIAHAQIPAARLLAVGRADTAPVAPNTTAEGRQQNRRIEIILLPAAKGGGGEGANSLPPA